MSVRCDSLFLICLYSLSSCVVIIFFFYYYYFLFSLRQGGRIPVTRATQDAIVDASLPVSAFSCRRPGA